MRSAALPLLLLAACHDLPPSVGGPTLTPDAALPAVVHAVWDAEEGATTWLELGLDGELVRSTAEGAEAESTLLALLPGRQYAARAVARDAEGLTAWSDEVAFTTESPPPDLPELTVSDGDASAWAGDGLVLVPVLQLGIASWVTFVDRAGEYVWWNAAPAGLIMPSVRITADGRGVLYEVNDLEYDHPDGGVHVVAFDGSSRSFTPAPKVHHDAVDLPDGRIAWLEHEERELEGEDGVVRSWSGDVLMEAEVGAPAGSARRVVASFDAGGHTPWIGCTHTQQLFYDAVSLDWTHTNSLGYDAATDDFFLLSHHTDALLRVDRESGERVWELGGRFGEFTDVAGDVPNAEQPWRVDGPNETWWSHGHVGEFWEGGFALFDNGFHHERPVSRVVAYSYDESARTVERTFAFESEAHSLSPALGDMRRLPGGNWLAVWSMAGMMTELTPEGRVVWRLQAELGSALLRSGYVESATMEAEE